jgi:hypothetical protein
MMYQSQQIVRPLCESGVVCSDRALMCCCDGCDCVLSDNLLGALRQITALPDDVGGHAYECGHPETHRLPDEVFWCPTCGSEALPLRERRAKGPTTMTLNSPGSPAGSERTPARPKDVRRTRSSCWWRITPMTRC